MLAYYVLVVNEQEPLLKLTVSAGIWLTLGSMWLCVIHGLQLLAK